MLLIGANRNVVFRRPVQMMVAMRRRTRSVGGGAGQINRGGRGKSVGLNETYLDHRFHSAPSMQGRAHIVVIWNPSDLKFELICIRSM